MRSLILSDIHGNIDALEAVLVRTPRDSYDRLLVLGDLVGYGASPNEVVDRIFDLKPDVMIRGNHDKVATGIEGTDSFSRVATEAARWTKEALTPENRERVAALPAGPKNADRDVEVCHGTPFDENTYVFDEAGAVRALESAHRPICFFGHTHVPVAYVQKGTDLSVVHLQPGGPETTVVNISKKNRYLVNPGSIGQPDLRFQKTADRSPAGPVSDRSRAAANHRGGSPREPRLPARPRALELGSFGPLLAARGESPALHRDR